MTQNINKRVVIVSYLLVDFSADVEGDHCGVGAGGHEQV
jgi:hypothetical protein